MNGNMGGCWVGAQVVGEMLGQVLDGRFRCIVRRICGAGRVSDPLLGAGDDDGLWCLGV